MKEYPDKYFDLAIVDPPYGIGDFCMKTSGGSVKGECKSMPVKWNNNIPGQEYFADLRRVSKKQIIWGANYYNSFEQGGALVWYKNIGHKNLSQCEIASLSFKASVDYVEFKKLTGFCSKEEFIHPCQKPLYIYEYCLKNYAKEGDLILDTHVGSASSLIACDKMGFNYVGYELDTDYYNDAVKRIAESRLQTDLFKSEPEEQTEQENIFE